MEDNKSLDEDKEDKALIEELAKEEAVISKDCDLNCKSSSSLENIIDGMLGGIETTEEQKKQELNQAVLSTTPDKHRETSTALTSPNINFAQEFEEYDRQQSINQRSATETTNSQKRTSLNNKTSPIKLKPLSQINAEETGRNDRAESTCLCGLHVPTVFSGCNIV